MSGERADLARTLIGLALVLSAFACPGFWGFIPLVIGLTIASVAR